MRLADSYGPVAARPTTVTFRRRLSAAKRCHHRAQEGPGHAPEAAPEPPVDYAKFVKLVVVSLPAFSPGLTVAPSFTANANRNG